VTEARADDANITVSIKSIRPYNPAIQDIAVNLIKNVFTGCSFSGSYSFDALGFTATYTTF